MLADIQYELDGSYLNVTLLTTNVSGGKVSPKPYSSKLYLVSKDWELFYDIVPMISEGKYGLVGWAGKALFTYVLEGNFSLENVSPLEFDMFYPAKYEDDCVAFIAYELDSHYAHIIVVKDFKKILDIKTRDTTSLCEVLAVGNFDDDEGYEVFVMLSETMQVWTSITVS